jgi:PAS domain S-box-containing protein
VLAASIGASAWFYLRGFEQDLKARVERELSSIAEFKIGQLVAWRDSQRRAWSEFREDPFVNSALQRAVASDSGGTALRHEVVEALRSRRDRQEASAALLLNSRGEVVVATPGAARPSDRELDTVRRALRSPEPLLDEGEPGDDLTVAVSIDARGPGRGALLVRYDIARAVTTMVLHWPHPDSTAEPVLVRRDGDFIVRVTNPLHTTATRLPLSMDIPTTRAVRGVTGIVECDDYRGIPVIAALRRVPDSSWYLSVKVDRAEVLGPGRAQALTFGGGTVLLLTLGGALVLFWWRAQVSAIRRGEQELEERSLRHRFDALWSQANDNVTVFEPGGRMVEANGHALASYGYTREEFLCLRVEDLRADGTRGDVEGQLAQVLRSGSFRFETLHRRKDGRTFPVEVSAARLEGPAGDLILSVIRDISERHAAASTARYQATLLENLHDGVIGLDPTGHITAWSGAAHQIYGFSASEALGKPISELLGGDSPAETDQRIGDEIAKHGRCRLEVRHARKDGQPVDVEVTSVALRDDGGQVSGYVAVHRDIGDRKRAEAEQQRLHAKLVFADRLASIGTLAAGVAHEINNPLAYLIANLEYLEKALLAPDRRRDADQASQLEALREADQGARRIREIVRGLRTFSRREGCHPSAATDLRQAVNTAARVARAQALPRARLVLDLAETPPVVGSEHELSQVVLNLVINAIQAVPEGRPEENEVRVSTRVADTGHVVLAVSDTGSGISPEHLARIFDPFFTTKGVGEGTGLGLSICHGIVDTAGGTIGVESSPGRGTTVTVRLPPAPPAQEELALRSPGGERRCRILVLDDEPLVCKSLKRSLEPEHDVVTLCDPSVAMDRLLAGEDFDIVLCDLVMPGMSGMDCFEELLRRRPEMATRMIFLTGGAFTPRARQFLEDNPGRWLEKPFAPEALRQRIGEALARTAPVNTRPMGAGVAPGAESA